MITSTNLTSLEVSKLTAVMTGGGYKRAASKQAAVARYLKTAQEVGMADAAALLGNEYSFDTAHHVLVERNKGGHASIPEALADASLTESDEQDAELAPLENEEADESAALAKRYQAEAETLLSLQTGEETSEGEIGRSKNIAAVMVEPDAAAAKEPKAESKIAMLLRLAQTPEGVTNTAMKALTGWTKLGGFFNAAKKAGLELTRVRENGDTTWRAAPAKAE